jgi:hypothetical protein
MANPINNEKHIYKFFIICSIDPTGSLNKVLFYTCNMPNEYNLMPSKNVTM